MYRQYENPYVLEEKLKELQRIRSGIEFNKENEDIITSLVEDIADLKERINFAWQDD